MILTVTMNPSVDTRYQLAELIIDDVNRVTPEKTAGGKGLNVARVLGQLGDDVVATGLLGGHMGAYMAELMDANGINNDFVPIKGETRICLNILHAGNQTELLESGPTIAPEELDAFTAKFTELAGKADLPRRLRMRTHASRSGIADRIAETAVQRRRLAAPIPAHQCRAIRTRRVTSQFHTYSTGFAYAHQAGNHPATARVGPFRSVHLYVLHVVFQFRAFGVVEPIHHADKVAGRTQPWFYPHHKGNCRGKRQEPDMHGVFYLDGLSG